MDTQATQTQDENYANVVYESMNDSLSDYRKLLQELPNTRDRSLALTKLDEAKMWLNSGLMTPRSFEEVMLENGKKESTITNEMNVIARKGQFTEIIKLLINANRINFIRNDASTQFKIKVLELLMWTKAATGPGE